MLAWHPRRWRVAGVVGARLSILNVAGKAVCIEVARYIESEDGSLYFVVFSNTNLLRKEPSKVPIHHTTAT